MTIRRTAAVALLATAAVFVAPVAIAPAQAAVPAPTVVSITFDDTYSDTIPALNLMRDRGVPATLYVNSDRVGYNANYLTRNQLKAYAMAGFEIGGHTLGHVDLTELPIADAKANICTDRTNLINLGYRVTSFAYPFGANSPELEQAVRDCGYNSARAISDLKSPTSCLRCSTAESIPPVDPYYVRTPASVRSAFTLEQIQAMVTQAEDSQGGWVPLVFHHICDACGGNSMSMADFTAFVDWVKMRPATTVLKTVDSVIGGAVQPPPDGDDPVPDDDLVVIGTKTHVLGDTNAYRAANTMIEYTKVKGATTGTNAYGTEVTVVGGVVTKVENGVGNAAIPANGYVLSGHGESATWLKANAPVGTAVALHGAGTPPPPPPPPPPTYPAGTVTIGGQSHAISGQDVQRKTDFLVLYTPGQGATTGANEFGFEAAVVDGKVTQVANGVGNMAIPANGYVLSGHGASRTWLRTYAVVGASVS